MLPKPPQALPEPCRPVWRRALTRWGLAVDLSLPQQIAQGQSLAYIDLRTRQTMLNLRRLANLGLSDCVEALMAHEAGHHCRYPQTLVAAAKLVRRQRALLTELETARPGLPRIGATFDAKHYDHLQNLLLDVLINDALREHYAKDYAALYRALSAELGVNSKIPPDAVFGFTLAIYEALWCPPLEPILSRATIERLAEISPTFRPEAEDLADSLRESADNFYLCHDLYIETVWPYLVADAKEQPKKEALGALEATWVDDLSGLEPDELVRVVRRTGDEERADEAAEERRHPALVELPPDENENAPEPHGGLHLDELNRMISAGNQFGGSPQGISDTILWYYKRLADQLEIELEGEPGRSPLVPTTLADWDPASSVSAVDWSATLGRAGVAIPGLTMLEREYEDDVSGRLQPQPPWLEIYIDSSYSMPDPSKAFSDLAFAGFLLVRAALSGGAKVRLIQFSGPGNVLAMDDFSADGAALDHALLQYLGGGTLFPFTTLEHSLTHYRSAARLERIALTDLDFFHNVNKAENRAAVLSLLGQASLSPNRFTAVLNCPGQGRNSLAQRMPEGLPETGMRLIAIDDWKHLHGVALRLGREIFG